MKNLGRRTAPGPVSSGAERREEARCCCRELHRLAGSAWMIEWLGRRRVGYPRIGRARGAALLALLALGAAAAPAQVAEVEELRYPPLPRFAIPVPQRTALPNGLAVMLLEDHELPLVSATVMVRTGARLEPAEKVGLAALAGTVLRAGGSESMAPDELDLYLESKAASIESSITTSFGRAAMSCLAKDFPEVLRVFAEVLRRPRFDQGRLEVEKTRAATAIARQNDNPGQIVSREFREVIYGADSPYARTETYASIGSVTRDDLVAWHRQYYHPNRMILGLVGDFDPGEALRLAEEVFGGWPRGPEAGPETVPVGGGPSPGVFYVEKNDMTQSNIAVGHLGITRDNPDYHAVEVLNQILSGSFASRLFTNVRSKKGLAYAVSGGVGSDWDRAGIFQMVMTTKVETTGAGIEALIEEARNLTAQPPSAEEVAKAKDAILNSFVFNSDSTGEILGQQIVFEYYGYPLDWLERYRAGIEATTLEQVRQAAAKYVHPDRFAMLVVGPAEGRDRPLSTFGAVTAVDITIPPPPAGAQ